MKILDRYIGKEVLFTTLFAVAVLSLLLIVGSIFKQMELFMNRDIPFREILTFIGYILPFSLTFTIPWGFLTAVLLVFGKLSAESELIALRSSGVSITRICAPLAILAVALSALCLWINVSVAPRAQNRMKNTLYRIATGNPLAFFESDHVISEFPNKKIYIQRKEGSTLYNIQLYELQPRTGAPLKVVHAKRGEIKTDLKNMQVILKLHDVRGEQREADTSHDLAKTREGLSMEEGNYPISLQELQRNKARRSLTQLTLSQLQEIKENDSERACAAHTEVSKRFSLSVAALAFALIGVPLAVTAHRKETSIGFLFSIIVALLYFFFILIADALRNRAQFHPALLMWVPNLLFLTLGARLYWRLGRD